MGLRGPKPTPKAILDKRGSWRAKLNKNAPMPLPGPPRCPSWLSPYAKSAWRQLVPMLSQMGVLTRIDANALARYCQTWGRWRKAEEFLAEHGSTSVVRDKNGRATGLVAFPQVSEASRLADTLGRLEANFALTPSARTRIEIAAPNGEPTPKGKPSDGPEKVSLEEFL